MNLLNLEINKLNEELSVLEEEKKNLDNKQVNLNESIKNNRSFQNNLNKNIGSLKEKLNSYNKIEDKFNKRYEESLSRNITGCYNDEELISLSRDIINSRELLNKKKVEEEKRNSDLDEEFKSKRSIKDIKGNQIIKLESELDYKNKRLIEYNNEIEKRKDILKYLDEDESIIFNEDIIIEKLDKKIQILNNDIREFNKIHDKQIKEINMLKTGKVLELPKELEIELNKRDVDIIYGMKWLKNNGYSKERNEAIVKANPFIPYSLIMDKNKIEMLKAEKLEAFTSSPIAIIDRERLEESLINNNLNIIEFDEVNFYISFNNKLLDEKELNNLIKEYEENIENLNKNISEKENAKEFYGDKKAFIKESSLSKKIYNELLNEIEEIKENI